LKPQASATKEDLWDLAYERLKNDKEKSLLVEKCERIILEDSTSGSVAPSIAHDASSTEGRERQMSKVVQDKFQAVQDARWKFAIFSKEIEVREQFDRAVGAVTWAKDFITQAVSPDPHAALAWAGVCVLLPASPICVYHKKKLLTI
jgi:ankyrin repeat domain-containing protein 50